MNGVGGHLLAGGLVPGPWVSLIWHRFCCSKQWRRYTPWHARLNNLAPGWKIPRFGSALPIALLPYNSVQ